MMGCWFVGRKGRLKCRCNGFLRVRVGGWMMVGRRLKGSMRREEALAFWVGFVFLGWVESFRWFWNRRPWSWRGYEMSC